MVYKEDEEVFFGSTKMPKKDMERKVNSVFNSVAEKYDLMNNLMSLGMHKLWKRKAIEILYLGQIKNDGLIIDLAAGTCDLGRLIKSREGGRLNLLCSDKNLNMLNLGRTKMIDQGLISNTTFSCFDALRIPLPDNSVDRVISAFGLRNFSDKPEAFSEIYRVLNPGGKCVILEFSKINSQKINEIYKLYSKNVIPLMGKLVANDEDSYKYLINSIENHPDQNGVLSLMENVGFYKADFINIFSGLVSIHWGYKT